MDDETGQNGEDIPTLDITGQHNIPQNDPPPMSELVYLVFCSDDMRWMVVKRMILRDILSLRESILPPTN